MSPTAKDDFARVDYFVMEHVFATHNRLGCLCDEEIYANDLAVRLNKSGLESVHPEVKVTVSHRDFIKPYWIDLIVGNAAVYELKARSALNSEHEAQLLHYQLMLGAPHGKLINFRPHRISSRFVNSCQASGIIGKKMKRQEDSDIARAVRLHFLAKSSELAETPGLL